MSQPVNTGVNNPLDEALQWFAGQPLDPQRVLWIMPRVEAAAEFKTRFQSVMAARAGQPDGPVLSPHIQTADRLSQPAAPTAWWALKAELVSILQGLPNLTGGLSLPQVWALAQEYLDLALRLTWVRASGPTRWAEYLQSNAFSAEEGQVVSRLADAFGDELERQIASPSIPPQALDQIVWLDDGEPLPGWWIERFFPEVPVKRLSLPMIEGPQAWVDWVHRRWVSGPAGPVAPPVVLHEAPDETAQAHQAAACIVNWLESTANDSGPGRSITVAVLDRLAARRLVALLAEVGVQVDDRTGWRLSTANVAGWMDALLRQWVEQGQIDLFRHPLTGEVKPDAQPWALHGDRTLAQWAQAVLDMLEHRGLLSDLLQDEAGRLVVQGWRQMRLLQADAQFSAAGLLAAWRHWAEQERFRPEDVRSPVRMVPLMSTRLRTLDHVLVLGCAASHFQESPPGLLPPAVAQELGFPGPRQARMQKLSALYELLNQAHVVSLVHCVQSAGKPESLLPELLWVGLLQQRFSYPGWQVVPNGQQVQVDACATEALALRALPDALSVPAQLSVTALDDFAACPLRFGLKHAMPWPRQRDEGLPSFPQLRGIFVHRVLEKAARQLQMPGVKVDDLQTWKTALQQQANAVWHGLTLEEQGLLHPFIAVFDRLIPRVAGQLMGRYLQGWRMDTAEARVDGALPLKQTGVDLPLSGRVDRLDRLGSHVSIVDIKFKPLPVLKKMAAEPLSAPQLPMYQALLKAPSAELMFLGIHTDDVAWVPMPPPTQEQSQQGQGNWGEVVWQTFAVELDAFFSAQADWQASPGDACTHCDAHWVCRPDSMLGTPE
ncbi:PD-(D/E)XK nuclease family protein [Limnobacter humi]|uniref:PD-(D/E)XK nuclease family protein n=1 Tax=Limnobacter humi TaxID=1778671 RepID=A0ABT1WBR4_9BURK|nr:PD-(D/E)XK nuclease family protein [Limnobacter humi]MCQ8894946.1 PD-(D/E)XK nuclease family protein [Limnobacter humi]